MRQVMRMVAACCVLAGGTALGQVEHHVPPPVTGRPLPQVIMPPLPHRPWGVRDGVVKLTATRVSVSIRDQVATVLLDLTLTNPSGSAQEAQVLMPVPDGVAVRSLQYDGVGPEPHAEVLAREEARRIYESIVSRLKDPALVEFVGLNLIRTSAFPVPPGSSQHVRLTYEQVLKADGQRVELVIPRSEALASPEVAWEVTADIVSATPIATVYSPSHDLTTTREGAGHVRASVQGVAGTAGSVRLAYLLDAPKGAALTTTVFAYPSTEFGPEGGGYFLMLASAPAPTGGRPKVRREVQVVLDRSGSMRGEKMRQAREAAAQLVRGLDDGEWFNIIDYSDSIASFSPQPVEKTAASAREAEAYLAHLEANGGTNIGDSLAEALRVKPAAGTVPMVIFLTDGVPTVGERQEAKLREAVRAANASGRRIFTFGVGLDVNTPLLVAIAEASRAASTVVLPGEDVEVKVSQVFRRLKGPVMEMPSLQAVGADGQVTTRAVREVLPATLPDVFEGDQLVVLGQYRGQAPVKIRASGRLAGQELTFEATLDPGAASARNGFVPRLWATRKVAALVDELRQAGASGGGQTLSREVVDEIVRLSVRYGILTEYTAFLAKEDVPLTSGGVARLRAEAGRNLAERAAGVRDGAGGVSQQLDLSTKSAAANAPAARAGSYVLLGDDEKSREVQSTQVRQAADRTFFNRKNRWVDTLALDDDDREPDETVEFASPRYFELAGQLATEGRQAVLAQDGDLVVMVTGKRVLVRNAK